MSKYSVLLVVALLVCFVAPVTAKEYEYTEISYKQLKLTPEEYKNDRVAYTAVFRKVQTTFLHHMVNSGLRMDRYFWIVSDDLFFPGMLRKSDEMTAVVASLKNGMSVKLSGRVKEFRSEPKATILSKYYLEIEKLEVLKIEPKNDPQDDGDGALRKPVNPKWRRKQRLLDQ